MSVHNYINTEGGKESGLTTPEFKNGQSKIRRYLNRYWSGFNFNIYEMIEIKEDKIVYAINTIKRQMFKNYSTAIIYGNTDTAVSGAGGHYYLVTGAYYGAKLGLYINDSVYNSPAYPKGSILANQAISPRQYLSAKELEKYWKPTGSRLPWLRKHIFLVNREFRP